MPTMIETAQGRRIACDRIAGEGPGVMFLGGFRSDMEGTKALALRDWARDAGRSFVRFDYSGHGASEGTFEAGSIGDWAEDAAAVLGQTEGPQILVGSSMGGWIALLLARAMPERIAGLVTIAAAPDFTEDAMWGRFSLEQKAELQERGQIALPSDYGAAYVITKRLIEEGRGSLVLRTPLPLPFPVRMLQGTADVDVEMSVALRLLGHAEGPDMRLTLVNGADHRFSTPDCLALVVTAVEDVSARA